MVLAARLACRRGLLSIEAQNRQRALIRQIGLPSSFRFEDCPLKLGHFRRRTSSSSRKVLRASARVLPSSLRSEDCPWKLGLPVQWKKVRGIYKVGNRHACSLLLGFMKRDKKIRDGKMRFVLPRTIGRVEICSGISDREIKSVLSEG